MDRLDFLLDSSSKFRYFDVNRLIVRCVSAEKTVKYSVE